MLIYVAQDEECPDANPAYFLNKQDAINHALARIPDFPAVVELCVHSGPAPNDLPPPRIVRATLCYMCDGAKCEQCGNGYRWWEGEPQTEEDRAAQVAERGWA